MDRIAFIINEVFLYWSQIILALAAVAAICFFLSFYLKKSGNGLAAALAVPGCVALSLPLARLVHWYCQTGNYSSLEAALSDYSTGGFALMGVFAACLIVAVVLRLLQISKNLPEMLDAMTLAGAAGIAVGRLNSLFNSSDRGVLISRFTELPLVYPVSNAVTGTQEYRLATFMLQAMVAAAIFLVLVVFWSLGQRNNKVKDGDTALLFFSWYGASQIVLDSTRYDSMFLHSNGFVSIVQILGCVALVLPIIFFSVRMVKARRFHFWYILLWIVILGTLGGAGYMEYYVQRHGDQALFAYSVMTACLIGAILLTLLIRLLAVTGERRKARVDAIAQTQEPAPAPKEVPQEAPKAVPQEMPQEAPKAVPQEMPQEAPKAEPEAVPEEPAEVSEDEFAQPVPMEPLREEDLL